MRPWMSLAVSAGLNLAASAARSQELDAEGLFLRGVESLRAGEHASGCVDLDQSFQRDPRPGALFAAAECHAGWGKPLAALQRYESYVAALPALPRAQQALHADRLELARAAIERLEPAVPRLRIFVPQPPPVLELELDGQRLELATLDHPLLVETGPHRLDARENGAVRWHTRLDLSAGDARFIEVQLPSPSVPSGRAAPTPIVEVPRKPSTLLQHEALLQANPSAPRGTSTWRGVGWGLSALGAVGIVTGAVSGIVVLHQQSVVASECGPRPDVTGRTPCSPHGIDAVTSGRRWATVANLGFGVGIAGLAAGVATLFLTDSGTRERESSAGWLPAMAVHPSGAAELQWSQRW